MKRKSTSIAIGEVKIGGGNPIAVQSMTNTDTADVEATTAQIIELARAGSELVRITVNNEAAAQAVPLIKNAVRAAGCTVPLIGDFHFNGHLLLTKYPECAHSLDKYRINPGTVGSGDLHDANFAAMINVAIKNDKPVRIGVNWGSLDRELLTHLMEKNAHTTSRLSDKEVLREALIQSALLSAQRAKELGLPHNKIILGIKISDVSLLIDATRQLAQQCDYSLHLGLTEAGSGTKGIVASSIALGVLLHEGIGDTIRVSLTPLPNEPRTREVEVCRLILQSCGVRYFRPFVTSCPGCGRTGNDRYQKLAHSINMYIDDRFDAWRKKYPGVERMVIAVMGCVVNGPGEARHADIGISLPGKSEEPHAVIFLRGKPYKTLIGSTIEKDFLTILENFVAQTYSYNRGSRRPLQSR